MYIAFQKKLQAFLRVFCVKDFASPKAMATLGEAVRSVGGFVLDVIGKAITEKTRSNTIVAEGEKSPWDGRFSQDNKSWARSIQIAGGDEGIRDHRWRFVVDKSHPGLTDMFATMVRHDQELDRSQRASVLKKLQTQPLKNSPNNSANFSKRQER